VNEAARARRRATHDHGLWAETIAAVLLMLKGYRILARRYRAAGGEIDVVAKRGRSVVFVEVKARVTMVDAEIAITPQKARRIARAARHWLGRNSWAMSHTLRCDAVLMARRSLPRHIVEAVTLVLD
jgi:putative endonuclease